jgi:hypothetical protein
MRRSKVDDCAAAIAEILADGKAMKSVDLDAALTARGFGGSSIRRGRKAAGVKASKSSFDGEWYVSLAAQGAQGAQADDT